MRQCFSPLRHVLRGFTVSNQSRTALAYEQAKPFAEIPHAAMLPFIGTAWTVMPVIGRYTVDRQDDAARDKRRRLGPISRERVMSVDTVVSFSLDDLETLIKNEGKYPNRGEFRSIKTYRESRPQWYKNAGLMAVQGKEWQELRGKVQKHILKPRVVHNYMGPMQEVAKELVQRIRDLKDSNNEVPDLVQQLYRWALEAVSLVGLDVRLGCLQPEPSPDGIRMIRCVLSQFECINKLEYFTGNLPFWKFFPTPTWKKYVQCSDEYSELAFKYIRQAVERGVNENSHPTVLQAMLADKDANLADTMTFVADMLFAGVETTSNSVAFLLYHLARNPDKQEQLYLSVMELLPESNSPMTPQVYESLSYLKGCLKEQQRLTPIIFGAARQTVGNTVMSGYQVPSGTIVVVVMHDIHMDEKIYPEPQKFIPERWVGKRAQPFAFLPFGFGPRSCVGRRLAELEMVSLVAEIVRNFRIEYHFEDMGVLTRLINVPDKPLRFNFIER